MLVIRPTQRLAKALRLELEAHPAASTGKLGDWYATIVELPRTDMIALVSAESRLALLCGMQPAAGLVEEFRRRLERLLNVLGVPSTKAQPELEQCREVVFASTVSKSLLGALNQVAVMVGAAAEQDFPAAPDLDALERQLAGMPHHTMPGHFPDRAARQLFGTGG